MKNTFGTHLSITLFGESHGEAIGAILDGVPSGTIIDEAFIQQMLDRRKPHGSISTARAEADTPHFLSGVLNGRAQGTPIAFMIQNENVRRADYEKTKTRIRPSHADYTGQMKYHGYQDASGGGHFSGRLTTPIVVAGAICMSMLKEKGIQIGTHIQSLHTIEDRAFDIDALDQEIQILFDKQFPVLDDAQGQKMIEAIEKAREEKDSLGGILETVIIGVEAGIGEPWFDTVEGLLSHALFSIPAVKGVSFGSGFDFAKMKGSEANDAFYYEDGIVKTKTNHNGGVNGGITNGMPIQFKTVIKPTPSIAQRQDTIDIETKENTTIEINGRHDPAIIHRARIVVDAMCAITLVNLLMERYGYEYFVEVAQ